MSYFLAFAYSLLPTTAVGLLVDSLYNRVLETPFCTKIPFFLSQKYHF